MPHEAPRAPVNTEKERTTFSIGAASEKNDAKSEKNEDTLAAVPERGAFAVFDGMGGHEGGARAASLATETFLAGTELVKPHYKNFEDAAADVFLIAEEINKTIEREKRGPLNDMGATGAIGFFTRIGKEQDDTFFILHGGDVRIYAYDEEQLTALTTDNAYLKMPEREKKEKRRIQEVLSHVENEGDFLRFAEGDAREARALKKLFGIRRLVQNPFGHMKYDPELTAFKAPLGSRKLICSDGVHDNLTDPEIERILSENPDDELAAQRLIEAAKERSRDAGHMRAKDDDITALVITVGGAPKEPRREVEAGRTLPGSDSGFRAAIRSMNLGGPQSKEPEKTHEPEPPMEDILTNIRRIVAEDEVMGTPTATVAREAEETLAEADRFLLERAAAGNPASLALMGFTSSLDEKLKKLRNAFQKGDKTLGEALVKDVERLRAEVVQRLAVEKKEEKKLPARKASDPGDFVPPKRPAFPHAPPQASFPAARTASAPRAPSAPESREEIPGLEKVTSLGELYSLILKNALFEDLKRKGQIPASDAQTSLIKLAGEIRAGKKSLDAFPEVFRSGLERALVKK